MLFTNKKTGNTLSLTFRPFQEEDCPQIIACFRDAYGDSYIKPFVYTPEGIIEHHNSGELQFYVAQTEEGEIISIIASEISPFFPGLIETASQITRHEYAGYHLAAPMVAYQMEQARALRPEYSNMAHPLCTYSISQKTVKTVGYTACGFLLHTFQKDKFHQNSAIQDFEKLSLTVAIKAAETYGLQEELWVPPELQPIAKTMYENLGVSCTFSQKEDTLLNQGEYTEMFDETHRTLTLQVKKGGEDLPSFLSQHLEKMRQMDSIATISLYLNAKDFSCIYAYEEARNQGFFFQGFLPCGFSEDYVILHHPLSLNFCIDEIPMIAEYKPFAAVIRRQYHER